MLRLILPTLLFLQFACNADSQQKISPAEITPEMEPVDDAIYSSIGAIKTPEGFSRVKVGDHSFGAWIRQVPLKKDKRVFLYNGQLKRDQSAQFAVIDMPTGNKDLQQCADVVMRLRAEWLYSVKRYNEIEFMDYAGKWYRWNGAGDRKKFDSYLTNVFGWCGSASLEMQMKSVANFQNMQIGDVLVQGGFPGHAVTVIDMATDKQGKKVYMLAQGYQPAQDMHVLKNPNDEKLSPWYSMDMKGDVYTPEWTFKQSNLKSW